MITSPYVEVALPVPLRRRFTYRVPQTLAGKLEPGCRVAVQFGRRKLAGFVLGGRDEPPEGVKRILAVAGRLEEEPVFPAELFEFLVAAASYYLHPIGEVLRAAAPALPKEAFSRLRKQGFLEAQEALPGRTQAGRLTLVARRTETTAEGLRLGASQHAAMEVIEARGEVSARDLRAHVKSPQSVLRRLEALGLVTLEERRVTRDPFALEDLLRDEAPALNPRQAQAVDLVLQAAEAGEASGFLLHGVTGSGKTEVYLHVIAALRERGRGALVMVPEIALTPQLVSRFRARFGDEVAVLHSALRPQERDEAWRKLRSGELHIAIGARSALFAPVHDLGVVIVDEEHDSSFKQEEGFRYQGRDMALWRARRAGAVCVLGSATPSLEAYHLAQSGKLKLLELPERATDADLPKVQIVDLARHRDGPSGHPLLTAPLHHAIEECLAADGQAILFLNRRGFAPSVRCAACGDVQQCPSCSVSLTEHRRAGVMRCHYCDFATPPGTSCASCGSVELERLGLGTERLEESLAEVFAPARVARLDRDTAAGRGALAVLDRLRRHEIDILVGTQMVTKGHDIPGVTLVGVMMADQSLAFPDFRAAERTFQLLAQVAGRAGRGAAPGRVVFQTYQPQHAAVERAAAHDYLGFYEHEIQAREELGYPPYARLVSVRIDAGDEGVARQVAERLAHVAQAHGAARSGQVLVLGPAPAPIARVRGRFRYRLMLRSRDRASLRAVAAAVVTAIDAGLGGARASVDIDPVSML